MSGCLLGSGCFSVNLNNHKGKEGTEKRSGIDTANLISLKLNGKSRNIIGLRGRSLY